MNNIIELKIKGMTCDSCASHISKALASVSGVDTVKINGWKSGHATVNINDKIDSSVLIDAVKKAGYSALIDNSLLTEENMISFSGKIDYDLIIIGGGSAAFGAAIKTSELGKKTLMINEGLPIGGTCVNVGCVPSKTLIRTAEQFHAANHPNFSSIKPGENIIDFREAIRQKTELVERLRQHKYIDVLKDDPNVTIIKSYGKLINKNTVEADGKKYSAKNILIATGSTTFVLDIPGLKESGYLTNETLYELDELPEQLIVIGGRYIALENAQMFARLGSKVTILQRSLRILPDEMPDLTENLKDYLEEPVPSGGGIEIKTGVIINSIKKEGSKFIVKASIKDALEVIEGTHLFVATGRKGNTVGIGLQKIGVELHKQNFIKTNKFMQTSIPNIYAAGDVTGEYLFVYSAAYEGSLAVNNMFNENKTGKDYSVFPWVIFTDPQVSGVGMDENQAYENKIDYEVSKIQLKDIPRSIAARNTKGFIKLIRNKENDQLIGARILASEGSELLMEISLAIKYGITVKELKYMFHPYLTLSEGVKLAAISFEKDVNKLSCCAV